ncbi:MAG: hypothetical protein V1724_02695, partial [Chloroflexota bacterium]
GAHRDDPQPPQAVAQRVRPLGMGQGSVELGGAWELPAHTPRPVDVKSPNSAEMETHTSVTGSQPMTLWDKLSRRLL